MKKIITTLILILHSCILFGQYHHGMYVPNSRETFHPTIHFINDSTIRFVVPPIHSSSISACPAYDTVVVAKYKKEEQDITVKYDVFHFIIDTTDCLLEDHYVSFVPGTSRDGNARVNDVYLSYYPKEAIFYIPFKLFPIDNNGNVRLNYRRLIESNLCESLDIDLDPNFCYSILIQSNKICHFDYWNNQKIRVLSPKKLKVGTITYRFVNSRK